MININFSKLIIFSCVNLLLNTSCSKVPESKDFVVLAVDGKMVFKENGLPREYLIQSHEINNLIIESCLLSDFFGKNVKTNVLRKGNIVSRIYSSESTLKIGFLPSNPDGSISCTSGFDKTNSKQHISGCGIHKSDQQLQYALNLREQLQSEYGMGRDAVWKLYTFADDGKTSNESIETAKITNENILCKTIFLEKPNKPS